MTDEELMVRYGKADDAKAFDELYRRYSSRVYGYLVKNCWNAKDAEEIHQNVFLKVHNQRAYFDPKYPFSAWLFTMVKNTMIDDFRKKKSQKKVLEKSQVDLQPTIEPEKVEVNLPQDLDLGQKKLLELRYLEEWSFEEIAKEFQVNAATIRKRISRVLRQLRGQHE